MAFFSNFLDGLGSMFGITGLGGPGGARPDGGLGGQVTNIGHQLGDAGTGFLSGSQQLPQLSNMGAYSGIPGVANEMASLVGVQSPFGNQPGGIPFGQNNGTGVPYHPGAVNPWMNGGSTGGAPADPYALGGYQQEGFNASADMLNQGRQSSKASMEANLASQGIDDPRATAAAGASIDAGTNQQIQQAHAQAAQQAFQQRMSTLGGFMPLLQQLGSAQMGQQQQGVGNALNFLNSAGSMFGGQANRNTQTAQNNMGQLNGMLQLGAFGLGGGFGGMGGGGGGAPWQQSVGMFG